MARPVRVAGSRNPKAIGGRTLILVFTVDRAVAEAVAGGGEDAGKVVAELFRSLGEFGDPAAGGPRWPAGTGVFACFAVALEWPP
jgi:hypothetical protein